MKKIMVLILLILLTACTPEVDDIDPIIEEPINEEVEPVEHIPCSNKQTTTVQSTVTLNSNTLWENSEVCENIILTEEGIVLEDPTEKGKLETGAFLIEQFDELVPSWNVLMDKDSSVAISIAVGNEEGFGSYFVMGTWKENWKKSFSNQSNDYATVYIDTVVRKIEEVDRFKLKVIFHEGNEQYPILQNLSVTTKPHNQSMSVDTSILTEREIIVSPLQQLSIPTIGNSICSPTSTTMVLDYYGHTFTPTEVSETVYDQGASIYGNWSFNASFAGGFSDLYARVEYINSLEKMMYYINNDTPLVVSIKTQSVSQLEGSIMAYPSGHLVVLVGFKQVNDTWYAIINDPAEYSDDAVRREYKLTQFLDSMSGYVYVIQDNPF